MFKMATITPFLLKLLLGLINGGKANMTNLAITALACCALWYFGTKMVNAGDEANAAAFTKYQIQAQQQQQQTVLALQQINGTLSGLTDQLKDVKKTVENTDNRLWEVSKDVYSIKTGGKNHE